MWSSFRSGCVYFWTLLDLKNRVIVSFMGFVAFVGVIVKVVSIAHATEMCHCYSLGLCKCRF